MHTHIHILEHAFPLLVQPTFFGSVSYPSLHTKGA